MWSDTLSARTSLILTSIEMHGSPECSNSTQETYMKSWQWFRKDISLRHQWPVSAGLPTLASRSINQVSTPLMSPFISIVSSTSKGPRSWISGWGCRVRWKYYLNRPLSISPLEGILSLPPSIPMPIINWSMRSWVAWWSGNRSIGWDLGSYSARGGRRVPLEITRIWWPRIISLLCMIRPMLTPIWPNDPCESINKGNKGGGGEDGSFGVGVIWWLWAS